jgi:hypothetical protein
LIAKDTSLMNMGVIQTTVDKNHQFITTFSHSRRITNFGEKGCQSAVKETEHLHEGTFIDSIYVDDITIVEKKRSLESPFFFAEKRDGTIKGCTCANGSTQRGVA